MTEAEHSEWRDMFGEALTAAEAWKERALTAEKEVRRLRAALDQAGRMKTIKGARVIVQEALNGDDPA